MWVFLSFCFRNGSIWYVCTCLRAQRQDSQHALKNNVNLNGTKNEFAIFTPSLINAITIDGLAPFILPDWMILLNVILLFSALCCHRFAETQPFRTPNAILNVFFFFNHVTAFELLDVTVFFHNLISHPMITVFWNHSYVILRDFKTCLGFKNASRVRNVFTMPIALTYKCIYPFF